MSILETQLLSPEFAAACHDPRVRLDEVLVRLDMHFLFALVWSVGALGDEAGQAAFSEHLRKQAQTTHQLADKRTLKLDRACSIPGGGQNVHDYFVENHRWASWKDRLQRQAMASDPLADSGLTGHQVLVPTTESLKIRKMLELCLAN